MKQILVGVDGSPVSRDALSWAANLARRGDLHVVAVRVSTAGRDERSPADAVTARDRERRELDEWCASLPELPAPARGLLLEGDAADDVLLGAARDENADLLVIGERGAGGFPHLQLGSVAHHLTHHTTVPLAVVPGSGAAPVSHLVVGVDGSPGSLAAAEVCADLAARLDVGVTAIYAFEPLVEWVPSSDVRSWHHRAEADVREWVTVIAEAGVPVEVHVERDIHPVAAIARALAAHPDAAAVLGARGRGGFSGLRLGRVPLQVLRHSGATIIVVPEPQHG